jgi:hydrogenase expression/formation protein HypD
MSDRRAEVTGGKPLVALEALREPTALRALADRLRGVVQEQELCFMHVCGTHENVISRHGLRSLLPPGLRVIAGPGCPVCVCPPADIDLAVRAAAERGATVTTFGDMMYVPGRTSLAETRASGGDVRVVQGPAHAVDIARADPERQVVFLAVGFETTSCTVSAALLADPPPNFSVIVSHRLIPPALDALLEMEGLQIHGFLLPGHVIAVTGLEDYEPIAERSRKPMVVGGFEPADILLALIRLAEIARDPDAPRVDNAYPRAVRKRGNRAAAGAIQRAFRPDDGRWRGLGVIPGSALALRPELEHLDALPRLGLEPDPSLPETLPGCQCGEVMIGLVEPEQCRLFGTGCTPGSPRGPCMVSLEGTCRSRYLYREVVS